MEYCEVLVKEAAEHHLVSDKAGHIYKFDTSYFIQTGETYDENTSAKFQQT